MPATLTLARIWVRNEQGMTNGGISDDVIRDGLNV